MYCIKCGVELSDSQKKCPLCQTVVYHPELTQPEGERLYPDRTPPKKPASKAFQTLTTALTILAALIVFLSDTQLSGDVTWSGYVMGALGLGYVILFLPIWFRKPNPVIFVPCGFAAACVYLLYICLKTDGNWFLSFAFPVTGGVCLLVTAVIALCKYLPRGRLYTFGGASITFGGFLILVEFLMNLTFGITKFIWWSLYPLAVLVILGGFLIYLAICEPARQTMERKFFI